MTRLAAEQAKLGHEVTVAALDYERHGPAVDPAPAKLNLTKAEFLAVHDRGWSPAFARKVKELAKSVDIIHNHGLWMWPNKYARCAANEAGKPLVISTRGMVEGWSLGRSVARKFVAWHLFERKNLESAALFHATSESEAKSIEDAFQFKFKLKFKRGYGLQAAGYRDDPSSISDLPIAGWPRIVVAANGADVPERIPSREVVEARFPRLRGKKWLLFMSRIHPKKGIDLLLQAWKEQLAAAPSGLGLRLSEVVLVIAGADTQGYGKEVERMIMEKELGETVMMTGHVDEEVREALLGHSMFLVLPSHSENFGLVVAESLAAGRPVLTTTGTPWGATRSSIRMRIRIKEDDNEQSMNLEENGCGVICEVSGLNKALGRMLRFSDEQLEEMGRKGKKMVAERFSWKAAAETILEAYGGLIRNSEFGFRK